MLKSINSKNVTALVTIQEMQIFKSQGVTLYAYLSK